MKMSDIAVAKKLAIGFGIVVAVIVSAAAFLSWQMQGLREAERLHNISGTALDEVNKLSVDVLTAQSAARNFVLTSADADRATVETALSDYSTDLSNLQSIISAEAPVLLPRLDAYGKSVAVYVDQFIKDYVRLASAPATRPQAVDMVANGVSRPVTTAMDQALAALRADTDRWGRGWSKAAGDAVTQMAVVVVASGVVSAVLACLMAWMIARAIARPIGAMTAAMQALARGEHAVAVPALGQRDEVGAMAEAVQVFKAAAVEKQRLEADALAAGRLTEAERARTAAHLAEAAAQQAHVVERVASGLSRLSGGDLAHRIEEAFPADYERLRADFNGAMARLQDTMRAVAASASAIRSGTGEISAASDDLSRRTEQQAASLEETAAALDEITATVRRTAEGSKHARMVVGDARSDAERSDAVVRQAVDAMAGIERSSREIGQIIGVIDEIAFQTNLLALNAGVEAARAGDAGRGFAVVASEVRALAQRSAEAAKEIKALISTSGIQVEQGVTYVGQTGEALVRIISRVAEIDGIVGEIASSAQEQATALDEVNTAVNQMDQVTQQNAAMVEQSTAASHALAQETGELTRLMDGFRGGGDAETGTHVPDAGAKARFRPSPPRPVAMLKTVGRGGAAAKPEASPRGWEEF